MYMVWRRVFFRIPDEKGIIKIITYEKIVSQTNKKDKKKKRNKYKFKITDLNETMMHKMLDWLVYRCEHQELKKSFHKNLY